MSNELENLTFVPKVYIIESAKYSEYLAERSEGAILCKSLKMMGIESFYFPVFTLDGLKFALEKIVFPLEDRPDKGIAKIPVLHVSAHGNDDCFVLTNGDIVDWKQFKNLLIPVNQACFQMLTISMSVCEGFNAFKTAHVYDKSKCPFLYLIGPRNVTPWVESLLAFQVFYYNYSLLVEERLEELKSKLNTVAPNNNFDTCDGPEEQERFRERLRKYIRRIMANQSRH